MTDRVPYIGGPMDGKECQFIPWNGMTVSDAADTLTCLNGDGHVVTLFGQHTYRLECYAKGEERRYQLVWESYRKPTVEPGLVLVEITP